jgi:hypothetical protein
VMIGILSIGFSAKSFAAQDLGSASKQETTGKVRAPFKGRLTSAQRAAVQTALKSLRKLGATTEIKLSQAEYNSRLIDTKVDVEEALRIAPANYPSVEHIKKSLAAYQDASEAWGHNMDFHMWSILKDTNISAPRIVRKYAIPVDFESNTEQSLSREQLAEYAHHVITKGCWKVAHAEYDRAEANIK